MKFDKKSNIEELLKRLFRWRIIGPGSRAVRQLIEERPSDANGLREIETCRVLVSSCSGGTTC